MQLMLPDFSRQEENSWFRWSVAFPPFQRKISFLVWKQKYINNGAVQSFERLNWLLGIGTNDNPSRYYYVRIIILLIRKRGEGLFSALARPGWDSFLSVFLNGAILSVIPSFSTLWWKLIGLLHSKQLIDVKLCCWVESLCWLKEILYQAQFN